MTGASANRDLSWLIQGLVQRIPHTRGALLLSSDGLVKATASISKDAADHLAAISSGLWSLASSAGRKFAESGAVRQVVVEMDGALLFVSTAGSGACLAVLAGEAADPGVIGYEMAQLVRSVRPYLETAPRHETAEMERIAQAAASAVQATEPRT